MNLTSTQKAYIAGFLDGDGSVYVRAKANTTYRFGYQIAPSIILFQSAKSEDALTELSKMLDLGYIRERNDGILELTINKLDEILKFISMVERYTIFKRKQIVLMKQIIETKKLVKNEADFKILLKLIDKYRTINYSKKRKIICP